MTMMEMRISLASETVEADVSRECLIFKLLKATACLIPTSDRSISGISTCSIQVTAPRSCRRFAEAAKTRINIMVKMDLAPSRGAPNIRAVLDNAPMADLYPSIAQTAVVAIALKVLLFPA